MKIDLVDLSCEFHKARQLKRSNHDVLDRLRPGIFQYDYLSLTSLVSDVEQLITAVQTPPRNGGYVALDIGCRNSPYRSLIESRGFILKTLDIDDFGLPDFVGTIEATGLPDDYADLVLCTQVLEHSIDPARGMREVFRVLRSGGYLVASAPHVWFYHPHPTDNWRFTQEGLIRLVIAAGFEPLRLLSQGGSVLSFFQIVNFLLYGLFGSRGAPFYAINNIAGKWGDHFLPNTLFCHNFAVLARKPLKWV